MALPHQAEDLKTHLHKQGLLENKTADFSGIQCPAVRARLSDIGGQTFQVSRGEAHKDIKPFVRQEQTGVCESSEHGIWKSLPAYFASLFRRYKT